MRASPGHDLRIMFPMIATVDEVRRARSLLDEARREVTAAGASADGPVRRRGRAALAPNPGGR